MRSFSIHGVGAAVLGIGCVLVAGCVEVQGACPRPIGAFHATYSILAGNCAPQVARDLVLNRDDRLNNIATVMTLSDSVTTEVNLIGCTIGVKQRITDPGGTRVISDLEGELTVEDESGLSGQMNYIEYMPDGETLRCSSVVAASYSLAGGTLGAAAQHALASP